MPEVTYLPMTFVCERCEKNGVVKNDNCRQVEVGKKVYGPYCTDCANSIVNGGELKEEELNYVKK